MQGTIGRSDIAHDIQEHAMRGPMRSISQTLPVALALLVACTGAQAQGKAEFDRRSIARYVELFQSLDRDGDGTVTWLETQGDLNFTPRFNDMDINRDGIVTKAELERFLEQEHGLRRTAG
jgi:Ca2+-binding EF-hand superfamily protein